MDKLAFMDFTVEIVRQLEGQKGSFQTSRQR